MPLAVASILSLLILPCLRSKPFLDIIRCCLQQRLGIVGTLIGHSRHTDWAGHGTHNFVREFDRTCQRPYFLPDYDTTTFPSHWRRRQPASPTRCWVSFSSHWQRWHNYHQQVLMTHWFASSCRWHWQQQPPMSHYDSLVGFFFLPPTMLAASSTNVSLWHIGFLFPPTNVSLRHVGGFPFPPTDYASMTTTNESLWLIGLPPPANDTSSQDHQRVIMTCWWVSFTSPRQPWPFQPPTSHPGSLVGFLLHPPIDASYYDHHQVFLTCWWVSFCNPGWHWPHQPPMDHPGSLVGSLLPPINESLQLVGVFLSSPNDDTGHKWVITTRWWVSFTSHWWCQQPRWPISLYNSLVGFFLLPTTMLAAMTTVTCYDFRRLRQLSTVVVSKVWSQMSLEECKSWTCIVLLGLRAKVQVKGLSIKD